MKREIVILRHAHADPAEQGQPDEQRTLSDKGVEEARKVHAWLQGQNLRFDRILCSPAARTRETAAIALSDASASIVYEPRIYDATPGELLALLQDQARETTLLVGHNPGLEQLVALLTSGDSGNFRGLPTAGAAVIEIPAADALEPSVGKLEAFWSP